MNAGGARSGVEAKPGSVGAPDVVVSGWAPLGAVEMPGSAGGCCVPRSGRPPRMPGKMSGLRPNGDSGDSGAPPGGDGNPIDDGSPIRPIEGGSPICEGSPALGAGSASAGEGLCCCTGSPGGTALTCANTGNPVSTARIPAPTDPICGALKPRRRGRPEVDRLLPL